MLDVIPKKLIAREDLNRWEFYAPNLSGYPNVNKYLGSLLEKWVKTQRNPLAFIWIQSLYKGSLEKLEQRVQSWTTVLGEENLKMLLVELGTEGGGLNSLNRKMEAIWGEIVAFNKLQSLGHTNLRKIHEVGDWQNDKLIVSVKSILPLDSNYRLIENAIRGMIFIKENTILREYNKINMRRGKKIDDSFQKHVTEFLETSFLNTLEYFDKAMPYYSDLEAEGTLLSVTKDPEKDSLFRVKGSVLENVGAKKIELQFSETRPGEHDNAHTLNMYLEKSDLVSDNSSFWIGFDTNTYWEGQAWDVNYLVSAIQGFVKKLDKSFQSRTPGKDFVGWINIAIHPQHEAYVIENQLEIRKLLLPFKDSREYELVFCLFPETRFELKTEVII